MSTRSLTRVYADDGTQIACMYRHCDGYPAGHGDELAEFLSSLVLVSGIGVIDVDDGKQVANGMGDVAAQMVAHFKDRFPVGGIYLNPLTVSDEVVPYLYEVRQATPPSEDHKHPGALLLTCKHRGSSEPLYSGPPKLFSGDAADKAHGDE